MNVGALGSSNRDSIRLQSSRACSSWSMIVVGSFWMYQENWMTGKSGVTEAVQRNLI